MKVFSLAILTLKRNKKQYVIYGLTLIFAIAIHLIFSEFIKHDLAYLIDSLTSYDLHIQMQMVKQEALH